MLRLFIACCLAVLAIANDMSLSAKSYGCQLLPAVKTFPSQIHRGCILTVPSFVCGGFCESSAEPVKVKRSKDSADVYQIQFQQDCSCCVAHTNLMQTAKIDEWKLQCDDDTTNGPRRNESVTLKWPSQCTCTTCRDSIKLG